MALYTGTLVDCGLGSLSPFQPTLKFVLSSEGFSLHDGHVLTRQPVSVVPAADGSFTVDLVPNDEIRGNTTYTLRAEWLDSAGNFTSVDVFKVFARSSGGPIADMRSGPAWNPAQVFWQPIEPDPWPPGWIWVNSVTGDVLRRIS